MRATITDLAAEHHIARDRAKAILDRAGVKRSSVDLTYDADDAAAAIKAALNPHVVAGNRAAGRVNDKSEVAEHHVALALSKRDAEAERARKLKLQNDKLEGELIPRAEVEQAGVDLVTRARSAFLSLGKKVAPRLAGLDDEKLIAALIEDEARRALGKLADVDAFVLGLDDE